MSDLLKLVVAAFIEGRTVQQANRAVGRVSTTALYVAGSALAGAVTAGCLLAALWTTARPYVGVSGAYLVVALVTAVLWFALFLVTRQAPIAPPAPLAGGQSLEVLLAEAKQLFDRNKGAALMAAVAAGLVVGGGKAAPHSKP